TPVAAESLPVGHRGRLTVLSRKEGQQPAGFFISLYSSIAVVKISPGWRRPQSTYARRASAHAAKKDHERAIADHGQVIRLRTRDVAAYVSRGDAYANRKEYDKAITDYSEAIKLDPRNVGAYIARGVAHHHRKEYDQAIADNDAALRIDPKEALALSNRGNASGGKGEYARAIRDNEEALRLDPKAASAHNYLAWLLASCPRDAVRDGKRALAHATRACELSGWKEGLHLD